MFAGQIEPRQELQAVGLETAGRDLGQQLGDLRQEMVEGLAGLPESIPRRALSPDPQVEALGLGHQGEGKETAEPGLGLGSEAGVDSAELVLPEEDAASLDGGQVVLDLAVALVHGGVPGSLRGRWPVVLDGGLLEPFDDPWLDRAEIEALAAGAAGMAGEACRG